MKSNLTNLEEKRVFRSQRRGFRSFPWLILSLRCPRPQLQRGRCGPRVPGRAGRPQDLPAGSAGAFDCRPEGQSWCLLGSVPAVSPQCPAASRAAPRAPRPEPTTPPCWTQLHAALRPGCCFQPAVGPGPSYSKPGFYQVCPRAHRPQVKSDKTCSLTGPSQP